MISPFVSAGADWLSLVAVWTFLCLQSHFDRPVALEAISVDKQGTHPNHRDKKCDKDAHSWNFRMGRTLLNLPGASYTSDICLESRTCYFGLWENCRWEIPRPIIVGIQSTYTSSVEFVEHSVKVFLLYVDAAHVSGSIALEFWVGLDKQILNLVVLKGMLAQSIRHGAKRKFDVISL